MSKWFGKIGFSSSVEIDDDVWDEEIIEYDFYGDLISHNSSNSLTNSTVVENVQLNNQLVIYADPYAREHYQNIKYVVIDSVKWSVRSVSVKYPKLTLSFGGIYNGRPESVR